MAEAYPPLLGAREAILEIVAEEEARFTRTLAQGMGILDEALRRGGDSGAELPPAVAFELHDTYGFPFDLTREIVQDKGMSVDEEGFERLMAKQRERARAAQKAGETRSRRTSRPSSATPPALWTTFVGYERLEVYSMVRAARVLADGRVALKLEESPFYAEGGGQVADAGWIDLDSGKLDVVDAVVLSSPTRSSSAASPKAAWSRASAPRRWSTPCAVTRRPATIPPPTCCTTRCA